MPDSININKPEYRFGVLWKKYPIPGAPEAEEWQEYSGWYTDVHDALKDLDKAAANPRCSDARVFVRSVEYQAATLNAVEWVKKESSE